MSSIQRDEPLGGRRGPGVASRGDDLRVRFAADWLEIDRVRFAAWAGRARPAVSIHHEDALRYTPEWRRSAAG
ncbi:MAG: hypothetical protein HRU70_01770 [Phycisphaeraceae bacterium]|nr:MAG: hypothetical protein HRU70_01770 [Phycisphaeraceae bacterium]